MLKISSKAEIKAVVMRKQFHGEDDPVKAVTVRMKFPGVPIDQARALVQQLHLFYGTELESQFPEVDYLPVTRKIEDVSAVINGVRLRGHIKSGAKIYPRGNRTVEIDLSFNSEIDKGLDKLHDVLGEQATVDLIEHEPAQTQQPPQEPPQDKAA